MYFFSYSYSRRIVTGKLDPFEPVNSVSSVLAPSLPQLVTFSRQMLYVFVVLKEPFEPANLTHKDILTDSNCRLSPVCELIR